PSAGCALPCQAAAARLFQGAFGSRARDRREGGLGAHFALGHGKDVLPIRIKHAQPDSVRRPVLIGTSSNTFVALHHSACVSERTFFEASRNCTRYGQGEVKWRPYGFCTHRAQIDKRLPCRRSI